MSNNLISIVIPLYNKESSISRTLDSIINQTYKNWEVVIIDDGSQDKSADIVQNYLKDSRIKYVYQHNQGVSIARNNGFLKASGNWILFLDADDYLLRHALSTLLQCAITYDTLVSTANFYSEHNNKRRTCHRRAHDGIIKDNFFNWYFNYCRPRIGATLIHKSILQHLHFDQSLHRNEDISFFFNIMRDSKISYSKECIMVYSEDYLSLSKPCKEFNKDYIFHINFKKTRFWEKMALATLINEGYLLYANQQNILRKKYSFHLIFAKLDVWIHKLSIRH